MLTMHIESHDLVQQSNDVHGDHVILHKSHDVHGDHVILHKSHDIPDGHNDEEQNPKGYISNVAPHIIESTAGNMVWIDDN